MAEKAVGFTQRDAERILAATARVQSQPTSVAGPIETDRLPTNIATIPFLNTSGEVIPAFAVMQIDGKSYYNGRPRYKVVKPDNLPFDEKNYLVNSGVAVAIGGKGVAQNGPLFKVLWNPNYSIAVVDEICGPNDDWFCERTQSSGGFQAAAYFATTGAPTSDGDQDEASFIMAWRNERRNAGVFMMLMEKTSGSDGSAGIKCTFEYDVKEYASGGRIYRSGYSPVGSGRSYERQYGKLVPATFGLFIHENVLNCLYCNEYHVFSTCET